MEEDSYSKFKEIVNSIPVFEKRPDLFGIIRFYLGSSRLFIFWSSFYNKHRWYSESPTGVVPFKKVFENATKEQKKALAFHLDYFLRESYDK